MQWEPKCNIQDWQEYSQKHDVGYEVYAPESSAMAAKFILFAIRAHGRLYFVQLRKFIRTWVQEPSVAPNDILVRILHRDEICN